MLYPPPPPSPPRALGFHPVQDTVARRGISIVIVVVVLVVVLVVLLVVVLVVVVLVVVVVVVVVLSPLFLTILELSLYVPLARVVTRDLPARVCVQCTCTSAS